MDRKHTRALAAPNAGQRAAREILLFILCFFAVWTVRATYLYAIDEAIEPAALRTVYSVAVKLLLWAAPACGFAWWIRRTSPIHYLGLSVMPAARQWALYLVVTGTFLAAIAGFLIITGGKRFSLAGLSLTLPGLLSALVAPVIEELLFRGVFLRELADLLPRWSANLLTSLLFAGIHLPFWLSHGSAQTALPQAGGVFIFSLLAGWLYLRSSSLWPSSLAHIANNLVASLLI